MNRRHLIAAGIGAAAAGAGSGIALWRRLADADTEARIWSLVFPKSGGGELRLQALRGRPVLLNFWATWCAPCITELPLLDRFQQEYGARGWQVVGLAVDNEMPVQAFLGRHPVSFVIGLAGFEGVSLSRALGNSAGALPFSVVFDSAGNVKGRKLGVLLPDDLQRWASSVHV